MVVMVALTIVRMVVQSAIVRSLDIGSLEPIGYRAVVMEAVTEISVLRSVRRDRVQDIAVNRPPALSLR